MVDGILSNNIKVCAVISERNDIIMLSIYKLGKEIRKVIQLAACGLPTLRVTTTTIPL
jgi:hypothetical protein